MSRNFFHFFDFFVIRDRALKFIPSRKKHILSIFDFIKFSEKSIVYELAEVKLGLKI